MSHEYDSKSDVQKLVHTILNAKDAEDIDRQFADLQQMDDDVRRYVVDAVEALAVKEWNDSAAVGAELKEMSIIFGEIEANRNNFLGKAMTAEFLQSFGNDPSDQQAMGQLLFNIHREKGDKAHPLVRAYVEEGAKMTDEEYSSVFAHARLMVAVQLKLTAPAPAAAPKLKTNPLRPKPPGGMQ